MELEICANELNSLKSLNLTYKHEIEDLNEKLTNKSNENKLLSENNDNLKSQNDAIEIDLKLKIAEITHLNARLSDFEDIVNKKKVELDGLNKIIEDLRYENKNQKLDLNKYELEIEHYRNNEIKLNDDLKMINYNMQTSLEKYQVSFLDQFNN